MRVLFLLLGFLLSGVSTADEKIPRVLILGDSVYRDLLPGAQGLVQGRLQMVSPKLAHGELFNTGMGRVKLDEWLGEEKWDLIHFNFGLGDLIHRAPGMKRFRVMPRYAGGVRTTSPEKYEENLRVIVKKLKATGAKLIWGSITPIRATPSDVFELGSEVTYNAIAARIMAEEKVRVNDMYASTRDLIDMKKPAPHGWDPFYFDKKPMYPPVVRAILEELDLVRPIKGPLKVFVMVGGATHVGGGAVINSKKPRPDSPLGSLDHLVLSKEKGAKYRHLLKSDGTWATRADVWVQFDQRGPKSGALGIGYGGPLMRGVGSELGLGHVLGDHFEEQVFVMKTVVGTPSLAVDLKPPSSGGAGKKYQLLLEQIRESLGSLPNKFPDFTEGTAYELSGLILNLGEGDKDAKVFAEYLPAFIDDLRKDLKSPQLPVVLVGTGRGGRGETAFPEVLAAQKAVAGKGAFRETVRFVETRDFWPKEGARAASRHPSFERWYDNAGSFYMMGEAAGKAMLEIIK